MGCFWAVGSAADLLLRPRTDSEAAGLRTGSGVSADVRSSGFGMELVFFQSASTIGTTSFTFSSLALDRPLCALSEVLCTLSRSVVVDANTQTHFLPALLTG